MAMVRKKSEPKTVLVVEDEVLLNEAYEVILQTAGYTVVTAYDGEQALKVVREQEVDLILLDLRMPVLDGIGFLEAYEPLKIKNRPKIVVFSNFDMQKEIDQAYALGADKYMLKAWASPKELIQLTKNLLK